MVSHVKFNLKSTDIYFDFFVVFALRFIFQFFLFLFCLCVYVLHLMKADLRIIFDILIAVSVHIGGLL